MGREDVPAPLLVARKRCDQCLFSNAAIVDDPRRREVLRSCARSGRAFECHKFTIAGQRGACRAFFDGDWSLVVVLAKQLGLYEFVDLPEEGNHGRRGRS
jgi:hypothetical protein